MNKRNLVFLSAILLCVVLVSCSTVGSPLPISGNPEGVSTSASDVNLAGITSTCPGYLSLVNSFYEFNNAGKYDLSMQLFTVDAIITTWGEGVNGRHWDETRLIGMEKIRTVLDKRGFRLDMGLPDGPIYHENAFKVKNNQVSFYLQPDRNGPDGRPHNPYMVTVTVNGCKIQSMDVVERFSSP